MPIVNAVARSEASAGGASNASAGFHDDWPTFAYDNRRTGYTTAVGHLNRSNVAKLQLRWKQNVGDAVFASPVAYAGNVIVVGEGKNGPPGSVVYDFRASDGHLLWQFRMGAQAEMTPAIDADAGLVIVANEQKHERTKPAYVFALRLLDGSMVWRQQFYALLRAAPIVAGGRVYVGLAGGDPPHCVQGGVTALDESTGDVAWTWSVDPKPNQGGSVWGAIAFNGSRLIFGTGNTCETPVPTANGAVGLSSTGNPAWNMVAVKDAHYDSDTGGGVLLFNEHAYFMNKNGRFYAVGQETGNILWSEDLNKHARAPEWRGGFASPTTDGTTILEGTGLYPNTKTEHGGEFCMVAAVKPNEVFPNFHSELQAMNMSGHVLWKRTMQNRLVGYVALTPGLGFAGLNKAFAAIDMRSGKMLWSHSTAPNYINASMIAVPSGVYGADEGGNVYAFSLPTK